MEHKDAYDRYKDKKQDERDSLQEWRDIEARIRDMDAQIDRLLGIITEKERKLEVIKEILGV